MSDSSEDGDAPLNLREEESSDDDERPKKRARTTKPLRYAAQGFVKSTDQADEDDDVDDERPSFNAFRGGFNLGEYVEPEEKFPSPEPAPRRSPPRVTRPSAFSSSGMASKSSFAARQMAKMGYVEGKGLGARGEGIAAPITAIGTKGKEGLGMGSAAAQPKKKQVEKIKSLPSTPGSRTPIPKARPKTKYQTITDIEAGGLKVPATLRSIIIDATGYEHRTVSSPAGFATPTRESTPDTELSKISQRAKRDLDEYANAWNAAKESEAYIESEERRLDADIKEIEGKISEQQALISMFETTTVARSHTNGDPSGSEWDNVVAKLQNVQSSQTEQIERSDLMGAAVAVMEAPFKREMAEWNPLADPDHLVQSIQGLGSILELEKNHRRHSTPFHALLSLHWFPQIRRTLREQWDVYNPLPAVDLLTAWKPIIPSWLYCRVIDELITPQLTAAIDAFRTSRKGKLQNGSVPPLAAWLFDWWALLGSDSYHATTLATLGTRVKPKLDSESWQMWKRHLVKRKPIHAPAPTLAPFSDQESQSPSSDVDYSFSKQVEDWAIENGLLLESLHQANAAGQPIYKLRPADGYSGSKGVVISMRDDVVFDAVGTPYGLDEDLAAFARSKVRR